MITNTEMSIIVILAGFPIVIVPPATTAAWPILVIGFPVFGVCPQSGSDKNNTQNIYVLCIFFLRDIKVKLNITLQYLSHQFVGG